MAGHMVRMKDDKLPKERRFQNTRKTTAKMRGLREERSEKGRGGRKWREKANNRDQWKHITKVAVLRSDQQ